MKLPFNKPYLTGKENAYIEKAVSSGKISGNGYFTKRCQAFFEQRYGFGKCLLTSSCTDALEMAAILLDIQPGDEVIMPSYTFVSTANAFVLRGAKIIFADSGADHPNLDAGLIAPLINEKTKAIVVVHYAGMSCDMGSIMALAEKYGVFLVEDAAQAIDSYYLGEINAESFLNHKSKIVNQQSLIKNLPPTPSPETRQASKGGVPPLHLEPGTATPPTSPQPPPKGELTPNPQPQTPNPQQRIPLGSIGHLAAFSFHETKNIISGEGGMLVVNDEWSCYICLDTRLSYN